MNGSLYTTNELVKQQIGVTHEKKSRASIQVISKTSDQVTLDNTKKAQHDLSLAQAEANDLCQQQSTNIDAFRLEILEKSPNADPSLKSSTAKDIMEHRTSMGKVKTKPK